MLADGMRNASTKYERSTIQMITATAMELSHPFSLARNARNPSIIRAAPPSPPAR